MIIVFCNNCGFQFETEFREFGGRHCSYECFQKFDLKRICKNMKWPWSIEIEKKHMEALREKENDSTSTN